jgi:O-antigen/teichoic acid export membrane protein
MIERLRNLGKAKFVRDTLMLQVASVVQSGTYLVTSLLTARLMGRFELGRWATSRELYMFLFFLVNMGLTNAAVSRYSHAKGSGDHKGSVDALAALLKLGTLMTILVMGLGWLAAPALAGHFYDDTDVGIVAGVLCLATAGEVLRSMALAVFNGTRQMRRYATFDAITNLLRMGLVAGALFISPKAMSVAWAFFAHSCISGVLALVAYRRARRLDPAIAPPPFREVLRAIPGAPLANFFGLSFLLAMSKAMGSIVPRLGMLFIPALAVTAAAGFDDNGAYQVGNVLTMVLTGVIGAIATNVLPTLGLKMGKSDVPMEKLGRTMGRISLYAGGLGVVATILSVPFVWMVIRYGYGEAYDDAFDLYLLLATGNLFAGFAVIAEPFYIYAKRVHHQLAQNLVYSALAITGTYLATKAWGPMGAAGAGGLSRVFVLGHLVYIFMYFRRIGARSTDSSHNEQPPEEIAVSGDAAGARVGRDPVPPRD